MAGNDLHPAGTALRYKNRKQLHGTVFKTNSNARDLIFLKNCQKLSGQFSPDILLRILCNCLQNNTLIVLHIGEHLLHRRFQKKVIQTVYRHENFQFPDSLTFSQRKSGIKG